MDDIDVVEENLDFILKHGDLYDAIALKKGVRPRKNFFGKMTILFLSRILFMGVLLGENIEKHFERHFSSVEKIREAQNAIRKSLGVNVDIIRYKNYTSFKHGSTLSLLYQEENIEKDTYLVHLTKILVFCILHSIKEILLRDEDIIHLFPNVNLQSYETKFLSNVLGGNIFFDDEYEEQLLSFTPEELLHFIQELQKEKVDIRFIQKLSNQIQDTVVKNAVGEFMVKRDIEAFKRIVTGRLSLLLNSEGIYKDKEYGKVFETVCLKDEYVKVVTKNAKGETREAKVISLYDYLEVQNFQDLLQKRETFSEEKERSGLAALYLHLCGFKKDKRVSSLQSKSLFDTMYEQFKEKKKIPIMESKISKACHHFGQLLITFSIIIFFLILVVLAGVPIDIAQQIFMNQQGFVLTEEIADTVVLPYKNYFELEKNLIKSMLKPFKRETLKCSGLDFSPTTFSLTGDVFGGKEDTFVGASVPLKECTNYPHYYAAGYAKDATYENGKMTYTIVQPELSFTDFQLVEEAFFVEYEIGRKELSHMILNQELHLLKTLYPIGNYAMARVTIMDVRDTTKRVSIDYERAFTSHTKITKEEEEILKSMQAPVVDCYYGSYPYGNEFVMNLGRDSYTSLPQSEAKEAILNGLGLKENVSLEEVIHAIQSKKYSKTPIQDAGLSRKIKKMGEKEYLKTIASLDSLVCNLAATLIVEVDGSLTYVVGYAIEDIGTITAGDAHAWAINEDGDIIDATPFAEAEKDISLLEEKKAEIQKIVDAISHFAIQSHLPIYVVSFLIGAALYKKFGKKVKIAFKENKIEKLLEKENIEVAYAKLNEAWYGSMTIPKQRTASEFVDTIENEFASFTLEDLKELKKQLRAVVDEKEVLKNANQLINEIPYIKEHAKELQKKWQ